MSKLLSLKLSKDFNALVAQEIEFVEKENGVIEVKAAVGSGKTTAKEALDLTLSAGNQKGLVFDSSKYKEFDNEVQLTYEGAPIFLRTYTDKSGKVKSQAYIKDEDGKKCEKPVINGKKITPAVLRDIIKTELSFGSDKFLSENPKVHMDFMMDIYSHKLKAMGVVFDKSAPEYKDSILWRLEQAKADRSAKEYRKKAVNGFKNHLEAEGWDENNIPDKIDIELLEAQKKALESQKIISEREHNEAQSNAKIAEINRIQSEIDKLSGVGSELMSKITAYNSALEAQEQLRKEKLSTEVSKHNENVKKSSSNYNSALDCANKLSFLGYRSDDLNSWVSELGKSVGEVRDLTNEIAAIPPLNKVPLTDGKVSDFTPKYTEEINQVLYELQEIRAKLAPLFKEKATPTFTAAHFDSSKFDTYALESQIEAAKKTNKIADRWDAFFDHHESDEKVKNIWKEYCEMFTKIDLGVPGLHMSIVGTEEKSEIRTVYSGHFNSDFFRNPKGEMRLLTQYSQTQRPVIAILLQLYLLDEKIKKNEDGLRVIWIEAPTDKKTKDLLLEIQKKYDLTIIVSSTGDFNFDELEPGSFIIENGHLLSK